LPANRQEARHWAQEALRALQFGQAQGLLSPGDRQSPDEALQLLAKIDAAR